MAKKNQKQQNKVDAIESVVLNFSTEGWEDYEYWVEEDIDTVKKINKLIKEIKRTPFTGTGKPEPLKGDLSGYWSRRINHADRLVYMFENGELYIIQCRCHY
uniref:Putative mRNA interferase YoeB n=1 Tax=uncultured prokaryote TaxID=198431 RepID=A0A0H5Q042_9ZZZZ|nr:hypothetical protein [uncultured prokaryote]